MAKKKQTKARRGGRKNAKKYVVGYAGDYNCVYGPDGPDDKARYADRMTRYAAMRRAKDLSSPDATACLYELVPVASFRVVNRKIVPLTKKRTKHNGK